MSESVGRVNADVVAEQGTKTQHTSSLLTNTTTSFPSFARRIISTHQSAPRAHPSPCSAIHHAARIHRPHLAAAITAPAIAAVYATAYPIEAGSVETTPAMRASESTRVKRTTRKGVRRARRGSVGRLYERMRSETGYKAMIERKTIANLRRRVGSGRVARV